MWFDRGVVQSGRGDRGGHRDGAGLPRDGLTHRLVELVQQVTGGVDEWHAVAQCGLGREELGKLLVVDVDQRRGVGGGLRVGGHDRRHAVAHKARRSGEQGLVFGAEGLSGQDTVAAVGGGRGVQVREDGDHAGQRQSPACVDGDDVGVSHGAEHQPRVKHARQLHVAAVNESAGHFQRGVGDRVVPADDAQPTLCHYVLPTLAGLATPPGRRFGRYGGARPKPALPASWIPLVVFSYDMRDGAGA